MILTPWEEKKRWNLQRSHKVRRERQLFAKAKPLTDSEAQSLISHWLERNVVKRGSSLDERREAWGMGA